MGLIVNGVGGQESLMRLSTDAQLWSNTGITTYVSIRPASSHVKFFPGAGSDETLDDSSWRKNPRHCSCEGETISRNNCWRYTETTMPRIVCP